MSGSDITKKTTPTNAESQERVIAEIEKIAYSDIRELLSIKDSAIVIDSLHDLKERGIPTEIIASIKDTKEGVEIRLHSKLDALEKLAKILGMYKKAEEAPKSVTAIQVNIVNYYDPSAPQLPPSNVSITDVIGDGCGDKESIPSLASPGGEGQDNLELHDQTGDTGTW